MTDVVVRLSTHAPIPDCRNWETTLRLRESKSGGTIPLRLFGGERIYVVQDGELRGYTTVNGIGHLRDHLALVSSSGWTPCRLRARVRQMRQRWTYRWWDRGAEITTTDRLHSQP